ncbi:MAG: tRNA pseudouridine(55) synthase TruB [Patescibacteria group bacterium]|nr:tRNA pseudouridine(55) synthase TruB [Patescibacteria group bacterium]
MATQGYLLIDKPKNLTSHDVINILRKITGVKKIGHAGTLDPNATGLLIVGIGREFTKKLGYFASQVSKEYEAEIILGETRDTFDAEGAVIRVNSLVPSSDQVKLVLEKKIGRQKQIPPKFSAIKIQGRKAYELARKGESFMLEPRDVMVHSIDLLDYNYPKLKLLLKVSSGTYIRSLANDIGDMLGCGAYLNELRRTKIGKYSVYEADKLENIKPENWQGFVRLEI